MWSLQSQQWTNENTAREQDKVLIASNETSLSVVLHILQLLTAERVSRNVNHENALMHWVELSPKAVTAFHAFVSKSSSGLFQVHSFSMWTW